MSPIRLATLANQCCPLPIQMIHRAMVAAAAVVVVVHGLLVHATFWGQSSLFPVLCLARVAQPPPPQQLPLLLRPVPGAWPCFLLVMVAAAVEAF